MKLVEGCEDLSDGRPPHKQSGTSSWTGRLKHFQAIWDLKQSNRIVRNVQRPKQFQNQALTPAYLLFQSNHDHHHVSKIMTLIQDSEISNTCAFCNIYRATHVIWIVLWCPANSELLRLHFTSKLDQMWEIFNSWKNV